MSKEIEPKLRFPDFTKSGKWKEITLGSCLSEKPAYGANASAIPFSSELPRYIRITDIDELSHLKNDDPMSINEADAFEYLLKDGDFLIARSGNTVGKSLLYRASMGKCAHAGYLLKFKFNEEVTTSNYFQFIAQSDYYWNWIKSNLRAGGQPNINAQEYSSFEFALPPTKAEQKKIADCLSSLNDLITAHIDKVEALKNYKKGLLQQLFPEDGENVPRLRFPDFKKSGKWKEIELGKIIEEFREQSTTQDQFKVFTSSRQGLVWQSDFFGDGRLTERDNIGFNIVPPNYITYRSRSDDRCFYFNENKHSVSGIISVYYPVFKILNGSNGFFIALTSRYSDMIGKYSVGNAQTVLSLNVLKKIKLPIPPCPDEQYKIANLLLSLDELIVVEVEKINKLKNHKKSLLQELFPSLAEVKDE